MSSDYAGGFNPAPSGSLGNHNMQNSYESFDATLPPQRREAYDWHLDVVDQDDPGLPAPLGKSLQRFKPDSFEEEKLEATKRFGGLLPQTDVESKRHLKIAFPRAKRS
jgi:hypothetical protein